MKNYDINKIRNLVLIGSSGAGKTTLAEHMLNVAKMTTRVGRVEDGNTVMDYDADEIARKSSISMGLGYLEWEKHHINIVDTPGYADFIGDQIAAFSAVETAVVVANAAAGFEVGLELALDNLQNVEGKSCAVIVNRMDSEHANYAKVLADIEENTGIKAIPVLIPIGAEGAFKGVIDVLTQKAYIDGKDVPVPADMADAMEEARMQLMEAVAETSESLMEKYFEAGELSNDEMKTGIKTGIAAGSVVPAFACSANTGVGVESLLWAINAYLPSPADKPEVKVIEGENERTIKASPDGDLCAYIFKAFSDPTLGDMAYVRVFSGMLKSGTEVYVPEKDTKDRIGNMYYLLGKNRSDAGELKAGDIGGLVKLKSAGSFNTLAALNAKYHMPAPELPSTVYWKSIKASSQNDEDKISSSLGRLVDEDPTVHYKFDNETKETVLSGIGEQQLLMIQKRLKSRYKVEADLKEPRIPYKETIQGKSEVEYKHKKQSGGRGQYGHVLFRVAPKPRGEGFEFINAIVGGVIPSKFIPAIEKGLNETLVNGIIAGYEVVDISVECYYGSYHDVDSSEMAFKIASSQALKNGFREAKPILLEPVHNVQIIVPNEYMGDVMGDVSTRRGKITGMEQKGKKQHLSAQIPLAELFEYYPALKSLTQGRGRFTQEFSHYEKLPDELTAKVMAAYEEEQANN